MVNTLGPILMDFKELTMQFQWEGKQYKFQGITRGSLEITSSHRMENLLKKGHSSIISQLLSIQAVETPSVHPDLKSILSQHQVIFTTPCGLPPSHCVHDYCIPLVSRIHPPNVPPYRHPFAQKNEIEKNVQELLEPSVIHPSTNPYYFLVFMALKKEETWCMCPYFCALNKLTIKDKFPIPIIDDMLDELRGAHHFTKLDLHSSYHHIHMKEEDIPKTAFRNHEGHYEFLVIRFGLFNAPSTFQSLMNHVFHPFLHHFVFFLMIFSSIEKLGNLVFPMWIKFSVYSLDTNFSSNSLNVPLGPQKWSTWVIFLKRMEYEWILKKLKL
jgi:hypothetical protein